MKYIAAYILLVLGGIETPTVDEITALLVASDASVDHEKIATLVSALQGKKFDELWSIGAKALNET